MIRRPPRSNHTDTLFPYTTLSDLQHLELAAAAGDALQRRGYVDRLHEAVVQHQPVEPLSQIVERAMIDLADEGNVGDLDRQQDDPRGQHLVVLEVKIGRASCRERVSQYV